MLHEKAQTEGSILCYDVWHNLVEYTINSKLRHLTQFEVLSNELYIQKQIAGPDHMIPDF